MKEILMTPYNWCLEKEIRIFDLDKDEGLEFEFYTEEITDEEFMIKLGEDYHNFVRVGKQLHLKSEKYLERRMYTLVPYNILGIQMGIQHEHSVTAYSRKFGETEKYKLWADEWMTSIVLNGGTSNEGHMVRHGFKNEWYVGSMQNHLKALECMEIDCSTFYEPDLNSMLTGVSFIVDERVFNRKLYPDYVEPSFYEDTLNHNDDDPSEEHYELMEKCRRDEWVEMIGGEKNVFLREYFDPKKIKLARG